MVGTLRQEENTEELRDVCHKETSGATTNVVAPDVEQVKKRRFNGEREKEAETIPI
jgi:hypothetical protein